MYLDKTRLVYDLVHNGTIYFQTKEYEGRNDYRTVLSLHGVAGLRTLLFAAPRRHGEEVQTVRNGCVCGLGHHVGIGLHMVRRKNVAGIYAAVGYAECGESGQESDSEQELHLKNKDNNIQEKPVVTIETDDASNFETSGNTLMVKKRSRWKTVLRYTVAVIVLLVVLSGGYGVVRLYDYYYNIGVSVSVSPTENIEKLVGMKQPSGTSEVALQSDVSRLGYCAIADGNMVIGISFPTASCPPVSFSTARWNARPWHARLTTSSM